MIVLAALVPTFNVLPTRARVLTSFPRFDVLSAHHFTLQPYCNVPTTLKPKSYLNPRQVGDKVVSCGPPTLRFSSRFHEGTIVKR